MRFNKFFLISTIFFSLIFVSSTFAIVAGEIPGAGELISGAPKVENIGGLIDIIKSVVRWTYVIFLIIAVLFIIFAAYNYLISQGEPEAIKNIHNQLIYAAIAIAVALLAVSANLIVESIISPSGGGNSNKEYWPSPKGFYKRFTPFQ